jgi:hypothetical protein
MATQTRPVAAGAGVTAPAAGAAATVLAAVVVLLATGTDPWELVRYGLYLLAFVLVPGVAAYLALAPRPGDPVRVLALGWTLGIVLVLASFTVTTVLGIRGALWAHPLVVLAIAVPWARRRITAIAWDEGPPPRVVAAGFAVLAVAFVYLAIGPFAASPLPEHAASVEYHPDNVFDISLVGEAMHHWPLQIPSVEGLSLRYHIFGFMDMAATANTTGVEASTLVLRLVPVALTVLSVLLMACLGRRVTGRWTLGVLAGALLFLTGELDLSPHDELPFAGTFAKATWGSPTYMYGLPFLLAAALIVCDVLQRRGRPLRHEWALLVAFTVAAVGAKVSAVPVLVGGLVLTAAWCLFRDRERFRPLAVMSVVLGAIFLVGYVALYTGAGDAGIGLRPFRFLDITVPGQRVALVRDNVLVGAIVSLPTLLAAYFALLGIAWMLFPPRLKLPSLFLLAMLLASLVPTLLVDGTGANQLYFLLYGIPPAMVVAAAGLGRFWDAAGLRSSRFAAAIAAALVVAGAGAAWAWGYGGDAVAPVLAVYVAVGVVVVAAALVLVQRRTARAVVPVAAALLVGVALADRPLDIIPAYGSVPDRPDARGTTRALTDGLRWVRDNTDPDDLLAVNVHLRDRGTDSRFFYFSALTERRMFLESWNYTPKGAARNAPDDPYPERRAINDGAIIDGDPADLEALRRAGVDYVLVDRVHGTGSPALDDEAERVFSNDALLVYRLRG